MKIRNICNLIFIVISWPIKKIASFFRKTPKAQTFDKEKNPLLDDYFDRIYPRIYPKRRELLLREAKNETHYKPLFITDYFSKVREPMNDEKFKMLENERKKKERNEARSKLMERLKANSYSP